MRGGGVVVWALLFVSYFVWSLFFLFYTLCPSVLYTLGGLFYNPSCWALSRHSLNTVYKAIAKARTVINHPSHLSREPGCLRQFPCSRWLISGSGPVYCVVYFPHAWCPTISPCTIIALPMETTVLLYIYTLLAGCTKTFFHILSW